MIKRKLKSMCGLTLAFVLAANMSPVVSYAVTGNSDDNNGVLNNNFESQYLSKDNGELEENRIVEGVDTQSEEQISVIVEFVSPSVAEGVGRSGQTKSETEGMVERDHRLFNEFVEAMPAKYNSSDNLKVDYSYKEIFNGVSLTINGDEVENLLNCPVVKRIHPNSTVQIDFPDKLEFNAEGITNLKNERMMDSVPHIGAEELHEENITGKGIKVGVLDTGIDYNHPDLTSAYKGFRAEHGDENSQDIETTLGWDFIDNDADPMETTYNDWIESGEPEFNVNNSSYYTSHGTHVSGTIAGRAENEESSMKTKGVAPDVDLYGYRVLGEYGSGATDGIIAAVEKSVKDGMDIINMSLGISNGNPFDPVVTAVNNATLAGVVTIIANGNAGPNPSTVGSPGAAQLPIAVGASTTPTTIIKYEIEASNGSKLSSAKHVVVDIDKELSDSYGISYDAVYCGLGAESDFEGKDLTGKVALVDRGDITFVDKAKNAKNAGAEFVIIMNNTTENEISDQGEHKAGNAIALNQEEGQALKNTLNENGETSVVLNKTSEEYYRGDEVTGFSSVGPVRNTDEIRPDIIAPGYLTFSTIPEYIVDKNPDVDDYSMAYGRMSGTSMAAPHVAGVAALILQENPDYTPVDVKAAIMNTAENPNEFREDEYSVHQQGAGRVNAYEAVHEETKITSEFKVIDGLDNRELMNETGSMFYGKQIKDEENLTDRSSTIPVTIENRSSEDKTYRLSVKYSESERAKDALKNGVNLDFTSEITVSANSESTFDTTLNIPGSAEHGMYEGYLIIEEVVSGEDYQLPFAVSYKKSGFADIFYPVGMMGVGQGISSVTSSNLFEREFRLSDTETDIQVVVELSEKISKLYAVVKNSETGEYIGYAGGDDNATWIEPGVPSILDNFVENGRVQKIIDGKISNEYVLLESGIYDLELIGEKEDGSRFSGSIAMGILNEADENEMTVNFEPGVTEVTEDMYTTETWIDGKDYEGIWIKGTIGHPMIDELKNEHGLDYIKQSHVNIPFFDYGSDILGAFPKGEDGFLNAGIERSDLENGPFVVSGKAINTGNISGNNDPYVFINEGESYLELKVEADQVKVGEEFNAKLTLNNVEDLSKGEFELNNYGNGNFVIKDVQPTKELEAFLNSQGSSIDISFEALESEYSEDNNALINFEIIGDAVAGITGDMPLFDVTYELESMDGLGDGRDSNVKFYDTVFSSVNGIFNNTKGEFLNVYTSTVVDYVKFIDKDTTRIYGEIGVGGFNVEDIEIYAVDPSGNRYETDFEENFMANRGFVFDNLPAIEGDYHVYVNMPGHLGLKVNAKGGELVDGEIVGTQVHLGTGSFRADRLRALAGDANEDGAVDMHDVNIVMDALDSNVENKPGNSPDFNQDGVVDLRDLDGLIIHYGEQDLIREDSKTPELVVDGRDLIDVLEDLGLFENGEGFGITLDKNMSESFVGEKVTFTASTEFDSAYYSFKYYTRLEGTTEWDTIPVESTSTSFDWIPEEAGNYEVKVRAVHPNGLEIQDTINYTVKSLDNIVVSPVNDFRATTVNKKNVNVEWNAPESVEGLTGYVLYKDGKKVAEVGTDETSYNFKGLKRHTIYNFKVAAKYANGELSSKESITLRTKR